MIEYSVQRFINNINLSPKFLTLTSQFSKLQ